jgi:hypothetical protein
MKDRLRVKGLVTIRVLDKEGKVKRRPQSLFRKVFHIPGRFMEQHHHNIITREGDALMADALLPSPTRAKVTSASGYVQVGTGWTGNGTKTNTRCNTSTGSMKALDSGYPVLEAAWGNAGDTTVVYRATFPVGALNVNNINEACLLNGNEGGSSCLAYAQVTPSVNCTVNDTLQVVWEIIILGQ